MKRLVALYFVILVYTSANAQGEFALYNLNHSVPQAHQLNPAFRPNAKLIIGLPVISSTRVSADLDQLSFNSIFRETTEQSFALDAEGISGLLRDKNNFSIQSDLQIFFLGLNVGNHFFSFAVNDRVSSWMVYNKDIAELALFGNGDERTFGRNLSFDKMLLRQNLYHEFALGFATSIGDKLNIGARVKILGGVLNSQTENISGYLRTDLDSIHITNSSFTYRNSGFNYFEDDLDILSMYRNTLPLVSGNKGLALDLGAEYKITNRLSVSGSMTDLGYISWKENTEAYIFNDVTYSFRGFDVLDLINNEEDDNDEFIQSELDSLENLFTPQELENIVYKSSLVTNFYAGVDYQFGERHHVGAQVYGKMAEGNLSPEFGAYYNLRVGKVLNAVINASFRNGKIHAAGLGASVDLGPIQIYGTTESVPSLINPKNASLVDARVGINLIFGKKKAPKEKRIAENTEEEIDVEETAVSASAEEEVPDEQVEESEVVEEQAPAESVTVVPVVAPVAVVATEPEEETIAEEQEEEEVIAEEPEPLQDGPVEKVEAPKIQENLKVVVVPQGRHQDELPIGHYVVVGAFKLKENAQNYSDNLKAKGYENQFGFLTDKDYYYVTVFKSSTEIEEARKIRNQFRQKDEFLFPDSWLLSVVEQ